MDNELINGKTIEEIDEMIDEYAVRFGEMPIVEYPQTLYSSKYVDLIENALKRNRPYTESEIFVDGDTTTI